MGSCSTCGCGCALVSLCQLVRWRRKDGLRAARGSAQQPLAELWLRHLICTKRPSRYVHALTFELEQLDNIDVVAMGYVDS